MHLALVLDYPLRDPLELLQFLDPEEIDALNADVVASVGDTLPGDARVPGLVRAARLAWLGDHVRPLRGRITEFILRRAVDLRYIDRMPRRDGRLWAEVDDRLGKHPESLDLSATEAVWLVTLIDAAEILDRFAPALQRHLAVFEVEFARLREAVKAVKIP